MKISEKIMKAVFFGAAAVSVLAVLLICVFLFEGGLPAMAEIGPANFLLGKVWKPGNNMYGIFPMILGSLCVTAGAILFGVPIGLLAAVYMAYFCPKKFYKIISPCVQLLAGIPSVVYGFFAMVVIVPFIRDTFGGSGNSMLAASVLLGLMILPTIIMQSEAAIRAASTTYYEGSLALGATKERSVFRAVLPAARSGIMAGIVLGIGRAIGETMAVVMVAGNQPRMPKGLLEGVRTMTTNIVMDMAYATDLHREALIATAVVLFVFILIINLTFAWLKGRGEKKS